MFLDKQFSVSIKRNTGLRWPRILRPVIVLKPSSQPIDESETGLNLAASSLRFSSAKVVYKYFFDLSC